MRRLAIVPLGLPFVLAGSAAALPGDAGGGELHWAFRPVESPPLPAVGDPAWARNGIDRFVLARAEEAGLAVSDSASRATFARRVFLDLLGLLPDIDDVDRLLADGSPDARERLVDRVLASPAHGERWGQHWLDAARYADSNGFTIDSARSIWPYRDWVIDALNRDLPFDRFTVEQLAGDLLPGTTRDQLIATGFHRNTLVNEEGGTDPEQFRVEAVVDRVNTTGAVWLGLTIGCAQCHDHKHDAITQVEYYRLFAFFNSQEDRNQNTPTLRLSSPEEETKLAALEKRVEEAEAHLRAIDAAAKKAAGGGTTSGGDAKQAGATEAGDAPAGDPAREAAVARVAEAKKELARLRGGIPTAMVMRERKQARETHVLVRGDFLRPGERVTPGVPAVLPPLEGDAPTRLDLARWLVDDRNPLTPRVTVNRVWQHCFGLGLVETENDFGVHGTPPSHARLLDWLAAELVRRRWSLKSLIRLVVTSATYAQSSEARPELLAADPRGRLLARQLRLRVEAEIVRDAALCASGLLSRRLGGPGVYPPHPADLSGFTQVKREWLESQGADRYRRGMYTFFWRSNPHPFFTTFDKPKGVVTCTRRVRSNTPLQALTLANDPAVLEFARALARRVLAETAGAAVEERIAHAFRLCLSRAPSAVELRTLHAFFTAQLEDFRVDLPAARALVPGAADAEAPVLAAWTDLARALFNLDEFVIRE